MRGGLVKRLFDFCLAALGLVLLAPLLLLIALIIKATDVGPIFFRQIRMGRFRRQITIWKFRTMVPTADTHGPFVTAANDCRVTAFGKFLRRTKLDELPQLWNVVSGSMSLVGPRPELPYYLSHYPKELLPVLDLPAGLTDIASLYFRNEERLLAQSSDPARFYSQKCLPAKLRMSLTYGQNRSLWDDFKVICRTLIPGLVWRTKAERSFPEVYLPPETLLVTA